MRVKPVGAGGMIGRNPDVIIDHPARDDVAMGFDHPQGSRVDLGRVSVGGLNTDVKMKSP